MKRTAIVGLLALASWSAQAAHDVPGWRVGAAVSFTDFDWTDGNTDLISDSSVGAKLHAQYQFNDWFGIEGAYHYTGDLEDDLANSPDPDTMPNGTYKLSFNGFSAAAVGYFPTPSEEIQFYGKLGFYDFDDELSHNSSVTSTGSESGLTAGAGTMIEVTDRFGIRLDFDWFDAEVGDLWSVNLGLEYFFGGSGQKSGGSPTPPPPRPAPSADAETPAPAEAAEPAAE